jgi:hypothetical protein
VIDTGPRRSRARRVGAGQGEWEAAVGERHPVEPVAQPSRQRAGGRSDLLENLERVQRPDRLAGRTGQVGMQAPAEAAVCIRVGGQRGDHRFGVAVAEQEREPAAIDQPGVGVHEL